MKAANFNYTALFYIILIDRQCLIKWEEGETACETSILLPFYHRRRNILNSNAASDACFWNLMTALEDV